MKDGIVIIAGLYRVPAGIGNCVVDGFKMAELWTMGKCTQSSGVKSHDGFVVAKVSGVYFWCCYVPNRARYRQARNRNNLVFRREKHQQEERDREAMEDLYRAKQTRKFYEKLCRSGRGFVAQVVMCRNNHGNFSLASVR